MSDKKISKGKKYGISHATSLPESKVNRPDAGHWTQQYRGHLGHSPAPPALPCAPHTGPHTHPHADADARMYALMHSLMHARAHANTTHP